MIRIYGGTVTEGLTDGVEVGTEENPILFNGLYPAPNGEATKTLTYAVRTDGETVKDVAFVVAMLDGNAKDMDANGEIYIFPYSYISYPICWYKEKYILALNPQTLLFKAVHDTNQIFTIRAKAKGSENASTMPDLRGKLYMIPTSSILSRLG